MCQETTRCCLVAMGEKGRSSCENFRKHPHIPAAACESALSAYRTAAEAQGKPLEPPAGTTAMGALITHISGGAEAKTFQPMNVNFGLFPPIADVRGGRRGRKERYKAYTDRAKQDFRAWLALQ